MRVLMLTHGFNSLSQRLYVELADRGHVVSVEFDISDANSVEAVDLFKPDVVLAPYLKRALPHSIWSRTVCLIVHPGPPGDRGPAALDWAVLDGAQRWGVTVLQAEADLDAGPIWASASFDLRRARKSSLYRNEVTEAAVEAVMAAMQRLAERGGRRLPVAGDGECGPWRPAVTQSQRGIDWGGGGTDEVLRKAWASDGDPGVEDRLLGGTFKLFDVADAPGLRGPPGALLARRWGAVARATTDGAVWIGQMRPVIPGLATFKRAAAVALGDRIRDLADLTPALGAADLACGAELRYRQVGRVGYLDFDFYNGALGSLQCERLRAAYAHARRQSTRVIVLTGGRDFWCNGMDLNAIESAASPAQESWSNINAIDDLCRDIIETGDQLTVAALHGNAAAGGVFLALAADFVWARDGVIFNPHYRNMGNLFGSEYWTYSLPRRVHADEAAAMMQSRLPFGVATALRIRLIDAAAASSQTEFQRFVAAETAALAEPRRHAAAIEQKRRARLADEASRPLAQYRAAELAEMRRNFFGFDPSYHVARHRFLHRTPHAWTPLHLARHRLLRHARPRAIPAFP